MRDKEFDKLLKGKLENYQPDYDQSSWEDLEDRVVNEVDSSATDSFDDAVRAALGQFAVSNSGGNWDEMERRIIEDENTAFDQEVRENVEQYDAPYDSSSWPVLDEKITEDERFRRRLIGAKILEVAAILIALVTFYNVFPDIKNSIINKQDQMTYQESVLPNQIAPTSEQKILEKGNDAQLVRKTELGQFQPVGQIVQPRNLSETSIGETSTNAFGTSSTVLASASNLENRSSLPVANIGDIGLTDQRIAIDYPVDGAITTAYMPEYRQMNAHSDVPEIGRLDLPERIYLDLELATPEVKLTRKRGGLQFTIAASMDLNALYMPEEQFYSNGSNITFSEKNLLATGYSAGAGLLFGDGRWSFETGLFYSSKKYEPNRIIQIGKTFDVRTVDFSEINLHIVSVPLYAHWNFDRKGKTRFYAVMGSGINIIATANYDLITRNNLRSAPPGILPDKKTDEEAARIREHILDGAEFSSKSYITLAAGFGVDYQITEKLSIFAQPTYNYQVPFFQFSDQNGKQFQFISMQLGTRVRLR